MQLEPSVCLPAFLVTFQAKLEPTGKRPGIMEEAAAIDALEDAAVAAAAGAEGVVEGTLVESSSSCCGDAGGSSSRNGCEHCSCGATGAAHESLRDTAAPAGGAADQARPGHANVCSKGPQNLASKQLRQQQPAGFSVGASADIDASYIASQRLLLMAGVKLRQHTLQGCIRLGQRASC